jgi:hypothetical protein
VSETAEAGDGSSGGWLGVVELGAKDTILFKKDHVVPSDEMQKVEITTTHMTSCRGLITAFSQLAVGSPSLLQPMMSCMSTVPTPYSSCFDPLGEHRGGIHSSATSGDVRAAPASAPDSESDRA